MKELNLTQALASSSDCSRCGRSNELHDVTRMGFVIWACYPCQSRESVFVGLKPAREYLAAKTQEAR